MIIAGTPQFVTPAVESTVPSWTQNATGGGCRTADSGAKLDWSHNAADMYLVESLGYMFQFISITDFRKR